MLKQLKMFPFPTTFHDLAKNQQFQIPQLFTTFLEYICLPGFSRP